MKKTVFYLFNLILVCIVGLAVMKVENVQAWVGCETWTSECDGRPACSENGKTGTNCLNKCTSCKENSRLTYPQGHPKAGQCDTELTWTYCWTREDEESKRSQQCDIASSNLSASCASCIKSAKGGNFINDIKNLGRPQGRLWDGCSDDKLISNWCSGIDQNGCNSIKSSNTCSSACSGTGGSPGTGSEPTCTISVSNQSDKSFKVNLTGTGGTVRAWIRKPDGSAISELTPKDQKGPYSPGGLYFELGECDGNSSSCTKSIDVTAGYGEYLIHCDSNSDSNNKCSGNPICNYEGGAENCISGGPWKSCSGQDNLKLTVAAPAPPSPTAAPTTTVAFRVAENPTELAAATWQTYTTHPMPINYEFKDKTPGAKFIFVQFKDSAGNVTTTTNCPKCTMPIKLLGPDPVITSCSLSFDGNNTVLNLKGQNFGTARGSVKNNDRDLEIKEWKDTSIKASRPNTPEGETVSVSLVNPDGQMSNEAQCNSVSQLALGAKVFCRAPSANNTENVDLVLVGNFPGGTKTKQKVTIDREGIIQGLTQKLEAGKNYRISIKAPKSLRKTTEFTAESGVTNIPNFVLPVGDVFPADGGDGSINTLDKAELNRQWIVSQDAAGRSGDFNKDGRVNSIDWACMRYDFGSSDNVEPVAPVAVPITPSSNTDVGTTARQ